jgi:hypothetical protein
VIGTATGTATAVVRIVARVLRFGRGLATAAWRDYRAFGVEYEAARRSMATLEHWGSAPRPDDVRFTDEAA